MGAWLERVMSRFTVRETLRGVRVSFFLPASDNERTVVFQKVEAALAQIEAYAPVRFAALSTDLREIRVLGRPDEVAHFDPELRACEIYVYWLNRDDVSQDAVASAIVHEAEHARLWRLGFRYSPDVQGRIERMCHRAERSFAKRLPNGGPLVSEAQSAMDRRPQFYGPAARLRRERDGLRELASHSPLVFPMLWLYDCRAWLRRRRAASAGPPNNQMQRTGRGFGGSCFGRAGRMAETPRR